MKSVKLPIDCLKNEAGTLQVPKDLLRFRLGRIVRHAVGSTFWLIRFEKRSTTMARMTTASPASTPFPT
jgi:hypothetical protein